MPKCAKTVHCLAAIDLGASNGRVVLGRFCGGLPELAVVHRFEHCAFMRQGRLRWDLALIKSELIRGLKLAAQAAAPARLESVSACSWAQDFGLLDQSGDLLGDPVSYRDCRTETIFAKVTAQITPEKLVGRVGAVAHPITALVQLCAVAEQEPDLLRRAATLLFIADLVNFFLSGKCVTDRTMATASCMVNITDGCWDEPLLRMFGLPTGLLPRILAQPAVLGSIIIPELGPDLARTAVINTAGHDTAVAVSVVPAAADTAFLSSGTWSMFGCYFAQPPIPAELIKTGWGLIGVPAGRWALIKGIAGLWLLQECCKAWRGSGANLSFERIMEAAETCLPVRSVIDPAADIFKAQSDMPAAVASFCRATGQSVPLSEGELALAIFAGLALEYRSKLDELERATGRSFQTIWIVGGGNRNRLLNQLAADALGRKVAIGASEATALGNLLIQAKTLGFLSGEAQTDARGGELTSAKIYWPHSGWAEQWRSKFAEFKRAK